MNAGPTLKQMPTKDANGLRILRARIEAVSKQRLNAFVWNIVIMAACVAFLWPQHSHLNLLLWWLCNLVFTSWRILDWYRCRSHSPATIAEANSWLRKITAASSVAGLIWGVGAWYFIDPTNIGILVFFLLTLLAVANGGVISYAAHLPAGLTFAIPIAVIAAARLIYLDFGSAHLIAAGSIVALGFMVVVGRNYAATVTAALSLHVENAALLEQANHQKIIAEQANQEKSRFFASVSHDVRQPLYAMGLVLESLGERINDATHRELHGDLVRMHDAITDMFNAALDVANLDSAAVSIAIRDFPLNAVLESVCAEFIPQAANKNLKISRDSTALWLSSDRLLFIRIIRNLLSNAIKFSCDGQVSIHITEQEKHVLLEIADEGEGIPENLREKIFAEYYQVNNDTRDRQQGFGLGLSVVQRLCRLLNIDIEMQSELGVGTKFSLLVSKGKASYNTSFEDAPVVHQFGGLHILMLDDDPEVKNSMGRLLSDHQCVVTAASTPEEVSELLQPNQRPVDLLICDFRLSAHIDGITAIQTIRQNMDPELPAILITGDTDPSILARATDEQVPLLHKPVKPAALFQTILDNV